MQPGKNNSGAVIRVHAVAALGDGPNEGFSFFLIELSSRELLLVEEETCGHSGRCPVSVRVLQRAGVRRVCVHVDGGPDSPHTTRSHRNMGAADRP